jgi:hypothetical protein
VCNIRLHRAGSPHGSSDVQHCAREVLWYACGIAWGKQLHVEAAGQISSGHVQTDCLAHLPVHRAKKSTRKLKVIPRVCTGSGCETTSMPIAAPTSARVGSPRVWRSPTTTSTGSVCTRCVHTWVRAGQAPCRVSTHAHRSSNQNTHTGPHPHTPPAHYTNTSTQTHAHARPYTAQRVGYTFSECDGVKVDGWVYGLGPTSTILNVLDRTRSTFDSLELSRVSHQ